MPRAQHAPHQPPPPPPPPQPHATQTLAREQTRARRSRGGARKKEKKRKTKQKRKKSACARAWPPQARSAPVAVARVYLVSLDDGIGGCWCAFFLYLQDADRGTMARRNERCLRGSGGGNDKGRRVREARVCLCALSHPGAPLFCRQAPTRTGSGHGHRPAHGLLVFFFPRFFFHFLPATSRVAPHRRACMAQAKKKKSKKKGREVAFCAHGLFLSRARVVPFLCRDPPGCRRRGHLVHARASAVPPSRPACFGAVAPTRCHVFICSCACFLFFLAPLFLAPSPHARPPCRVPTPLRRSVWAGATRPQITPRKTARQSSPMCSTAGSRTGSLGRSLPPARSPSRRRRRGRGRSR